MLIHFLSSVRDTLSTHGRRGLRAQLQVQIGKVAKRRQASKASEGSRPDAALTARVTRKRDGRRLERITTRPVRADLQRD
jgi:hypothetical protein